MANTVKTLEQSLQEAKALASMYKDLIRNGETREAEIQAEIEALIEKRNFLRTARENAPDGLQRAETQAHGLELSRRQHRARGVQPPSRAALQRKADREESLRSRVQAMAAKLREMGLDPAQVIKEAMDE